jgi:hypothetical protein
MCRWCVVDRERIKTAHEIERELSREREKNRYSVVMKY